MGLEVTYYTWRDLLDINGQPLPDPSTQEVVPAITPEDTITDEFLRDHFDLKLTDENNNYILVR